MGVSVFRLNFSHGSHEDHKLTFNAIKQARQDAEVPISVLADLQGPKIRTGSLEKASVNLVSGSRFTITTEKGFRGTALRVSTNYEGITGDVAFGDTILIDDGKIRLLVEEVTDTEVVTTVVTGGKLSERKALNLPGSLINLPALTDKDKSDLRFALNELGVDYVALSFVRSPADIDLLKLAMQQMNNSARVIVKIEKPQAVENYEAILSSLELGDGIMVARGDLGVEVESEKVPALQKRMIRRANEAGMICITATQMLESMMYHTIPSRAEASDIFNAVIDGTDAVMLSGETAVGNHPHKAVEAMAKIICEAEAYEANVPRGSLQPSFCDSTFGLGTVRAACAAAESTGAAALVALTYSGRTAVLMSNLSLPLTTPFFAVTPKFDTYNKLALYYGVNPLLLDQELDPKKKMWDLLDNLLLEEAGLKKGDTVVIASGYKISDGYTNSCVIVKLGHREFY